MTRPTIRKPLRSSQGFTLIELLLVILILGILLAVAAPSFLGQSAKAQDSAAQQYLATAYHAAKAEATSNPDGQGEYPVAGGNVGKLVSALQADEPELAVAGGSCAAATLPSKNVVVDNTGSTAPSIFTAYAKSASGTTWMLAASPSTLKIVPVEGCEGIAPFSLSPPAITLVASNSYAADSGLVAPGATVNFQWQRCDATGANCTDIAGATDATYNPAASDDGSMLRVVTTATNDAGSKTVTSPVVGPVEAPSAQPSGTSTPPAISGSPYVGETWAAQHGSWSGTGPLTYTDQWLRCDASGANCTDIASATDLSYTTVSADEGGTLRLKECASNSYGTACATSDASAVIGAASGSTQSQSPDGTKIVYNNSNTGTIHIANAADGSGDVELGLAGDNPSYSPDGTKIVYDNWNTATLHVANAADGSGDADLGLAGYNPSYSPDGTKIAYYNWSTRTIHVANAADGSGAVDLGLAGDEPSYSPDGTKIVYFNSNTNTIHVMRADGLGDVELGLAGAEPSYSPDGTKIVYDNWNTGTIHVANAADGSGDVDLGLAGDGPDF